MEMRVNWRKLASPDAPFIVSIEHYTRKPRDDLALDSRSLLPAYTKKARHTYQNRGTHAK